MKSKKETEQTAVNTLLEKGINVTIGKKEYHFSEPTLGMLDEITAIQLKMQLDDSKMGKDPLIEARKVVNQNTGNAAQLIAMMITGPRSYSKIGLFDKICQLIWLWKVKRKSREIVQVLKPSELLNLSMIILELSNTKDFIISIRLMSANRTTTPKALVEQQD